MTSFATRIPFVVLSLALSLGLAPSLVLGAARTKTPPSEATRAPLDRSAPAVALPFSEGFNGALGGWTLTGKWHVRQAPQTTRVSDYIRNKPLVTLPDDGSWPSAYEGAGVLVFSDDTLGTPGEGTFVAPWDTSASTPLDGGISSQPVDGDAVLPQLDLTGASSAVLSMWTWFEIESVDPAPDQFDAMLVQASTDGVVFNTVGFAGPAVDYNGNPDQPATSGGFNLPGKWVRQVYDLSSYAGQNVWVRLRFQSNDNLYNAFRGWFVDSLLVTSNHLPNCSIESVTPKPIPPGGDFLISGTGFVQGSTVTVGGQAASVQSVASTNTIEATAPFVIADGVYPVTVTAPNNSSCTLNNAVVIKAGATTGCSVQLSAPLCLPSSNGTQQVVIWGSGFQPGSIVYVGSTAVTPSYTDLNTIVFTAPVLPTGFYAVTVRTPQGSSCDASGFLIVDPTSCSSTPCTAVSMSPPCVKPGQGADSYVTITGSGFAPGTQVQVGNSIANIISSSSTQIVFDPPASPDGFYLVQILSGSDLCLAPHALRITNTSCVVATKTMTWGSVKALYR